MEEAQIVARIKPRTKIKGLIRYQAVDCRPIVKIIGLKLSDVSTKISVKMLNCWKSHIESHM